MEKLRVIGAEDDRLVLATESGERFTLAVDEVLRAQLRRTKREREEVDPRATRPNPREIQAQIRSGLAASEVAELLNLPLETVARYERPVLAEREYIVGQALAVPVLVAGDFEPDRSPTFGSAVRRKLEEAHASGERWTSWKESSGWIVKLEFLAGEVERDARWGFDPRRSTLSPINPDAVQLSRQGSLPDGLIPRLRALDTPVKDDSRFDSGAFGPLRNVSPPPAVATEHVEADPAVQAAAIKRAPEPSQTSSETADLLEALRRRRGQREPLPMDEPAMDPAPGPAGESARTPAPVALFDALEPGYEDVASAEDSAEHRSDEPVRASMGGDGRRKGRTSMPSWDEIVFGARSEDS